VRNLQGRVSPFPDLTLLEKVHRVEARPGEPEKEKDKSSSLDK